MLNGIKYWMALDRVQGINNAELEFIYQTVSAIAISISDVFSLSEKEIRGEFRFNDNIISSFIKASEIMHLIDNEYQALTDLNISVIPFFSPQFPERIKKNLGNSIPNLLFTYGNDKLLAIKGAALLTETQMSSKGEFISIMASRDISSHGITIISTMDNRKLGSIHRSALETGGSIIAFLSHGILGLDPDDMNKFYFDPARIAIVSIYPPSVQSEKSRVLFRNKVACGLSSAVYIIESSESGDIFEAAKFTSQAEIPLYITEYNDYPSSATGNKKIMTEFSGKPVRGRRVDDLIIPNMDRLIADIKFR